MTALRRISRPTWESNYSFQPWSLVKTFSLMNIRLAFLCFPNKDGRPRYFSCCLISWTPRKSLIWPRIFGGVDLLKNRPVLFRCNCWPKAFSWTFSRVWIFWHSSRGALQKTKLSLAKNRWVSLGPFLQMDTPRIWPASVFFFSSRRRLSEQILLCHGLNFEPKSGWTCIVLYTLHEIHHPLSLSWKHVNSHDFKLKI